MHAVSPGSRASNSLAAGHQLPHAEPLAFGLHNRNVHIGSRLSPVTYCTSIFLGISESIHQFKFP